MPHQRYPLGPVAAANTNLRDQSSVLPENQVGRPGENMWSLAFITPCTLP